MADTKTHKPCAKCKIEPRVGKGSYCRACKGAYDKADYKRNKEKRSAAMRLWHMTTKYGISEEQFNEMMIRQGGVCAICGGVNRNRRLDIDHCHETGRVRGLLCGSCNKGIGSLKDSVEVLRSAVEYLEKA